MSPRAPLLRPVAVAAFRPIATVAGAWLKHLAVAAAALGPLHSLAGATVVNVAVSPGLSAKVGDTVQIAATVSGSTVSFARAWDVTGSLPPGIEVVGGVPQGGAIVVNPSEGVLLLRGTATTAGSYTFTVRGWHDNTLTGQNALTPITITIAPAPPVVVAPTISAAPESRTASTGASVTFAVTAAGTAPLAYQWRKNDEPIAGATSATLTLTAVSPADAAQYSVIVTNSAGSATSAAARLTVNAPLPAFTAQPLSQRVATGQALILSAAATDALSYQWHKDGQAIAGATGSTLTLTRAQPADAGTYTVVATNATGSVTSAPAVIVVDARVIPSRLVNLAIRSRAGTGAQSLIMGFTLAGPSPTATKPLLVRAVGPTLAQFGLGGLLADPVVTLYSGSVAIATNDNWAGDIHVANAAALVGAFPFASHLSADAALHGPHVPGGYTLQVSGATGSGAPTDPPAAEGVALAEIYDAMPGADFDPERHGRLTNVSARTQVGTGGDLLIAGFTLAGDGPRRLLIRAVGPTLGAFGVPDTLADPRLELYAGSNLLEANDDWAGATPLVIAAASVGAFPLAATSRDAALLVTLPPGGYTAQVTGARATTGVALVEIYEVP